MAWDLGFCRDCRVKMSFSFVALVLSYTAHALVLHQQCQHRRHPGLGEGLKVGSGVQDFIRASLGVGLGLV